MASDEGNNISEGPSIKAETWFALAVAAFLITLVIGCFAATWVFFEAEPERMVQRAQAFTPFGAALLAVVTFCTVAWRGVLNTQQLQHQAEQLRQQIRQNDANDDANYAKLLQEGAKLLGEADNQSHQLAGIATLETLFVDPKQRFAVEAMDLLADYLSHIYSVNGARQRYEAVARAINRGAKLGVLSRVKIPFATDNPNFIWIPINGLAAVAYIGGTFGGGFTNPPRLGFARETRPRLTRCTITYATIDGGDALDFRDCVFRNCRIIAFDGDELDTHTFMDCNFSGAKISVPHYSELGFKAGSNGNYVEDGSYPNCDARFDWTVILENLSSSDIPF